jgi:hypothetical protein
MKIDDFNLLSSDEKLDYLLKNGIFIATTNIKKKNMMLYSIFDFYCELSFSERNTSFFEINIFDSPKFLDHYITDIRFPRDFENLLNPE